MSVKMSEENIKSIQDACLSDSTQYIRYLENKAHRSRWKNILFAIIGWLLGILTALLTQYLSKLLGLS